MTPKDLRYHNLYMDIAERVSEMSVARRLQVGAVIVKDGNITSFGWNGMPAGWDNNCEDEVWNVHDGDYILKTKPEVIHAEMNCLMKLASNGGIGSFGASLYVTTSPCIECAKAIYQSGIKKVFYKSHYRSDDGTEFLKKCNISIEQIINDK